MSNQPLPANLFVRDFNLHDARKHESSARTPAAHQHEALRALSRWFDPCATTEDARGALLVLPTGGGKTFTAIRFLSQFPLSEGYKVLWLAHTHHLLEQAFETLGPPAMPSEHPVEVSKIREPRAKLSVRVVSGVPGHAKLHSIRETDDMVIGTLQTIASGHRDDSPGLLAFLKSAKGKLFVVFDEAHHAPAPTYARFVDALRTKIPDMRLLGLTATPIYSDKLRSGWLKKLFPQGILFQVSPKRLMAEGILAEPVIQEASTDIEPDFDDVEFDRLRRSYGDLPESVIESLSKNRQRNDSIADFYLKNREKHRSNPQEGYGKTLIFADRWHQCEYLRERLCRAGVKADVVYSHVDGQAGTVDARNRRTADDNTKAIRAFKHGEVEVLINVRMLTEGTDVPGVQTVFLTRQTTSRVLLTQMVGRALRGTKFGGTEKAFVVSFIDNWKHSIQWAEFSLDAGPTADEASVQHTRFPVQLVSIELVRALSRQMYRGEGEASMEFLQSLPVGWYPLEFDAKIGEGEEDDKDIEHICRMVLVFDVDRLGFEALQDLLEKEDLGEFIDPGVLLSDHRARVSAWVTKCFKEEAGGLGGDLVSDAFDMARHMAQSNAGRPRFFPFDERKNHDLDLLARQLVEKDVGIRTATIALHAEFERQDRYWRALYRTFDTFRAQFDAVRRRVENRLSYGGQPAASGPIAEHSETISPPEAPYEMKQAVKARDGFRCLCCGSDNKRYLEVDHIVAVSHGGRHELENLQTLCTLCNSHKSVKEQNFRRTTTPINGPHPDFEVRMLPPSNKAKEVDGWVRCIHATLNHYYRCSAVSAVEIKARGQRFYEWRVVLNPGNDPRFLDLHLEGLLSTIATHRTAGGYGAPEAILIEGMDAGRTPLSLRVPGGSSINLPEPVGDADESEETPVPPCIDLSRLFNEEITRAVAMNPSKAKMIGGTYQFNIIGAGTWMIDLDASTPYVKEGTLKSPKVAVTVNESDFLLMLGDPNAGMKLYLGLRLAVTGNTILASNLQKILALR